MSDWSSLDYSADREIDAGPEKLSDVIRTEPSTSTEEIDTETNVKLALLAQTLMTAREELEKHKFLADAAVAEIERLVPGGDPADGTLLIPLSDMTIEVTFRDRWLWDQGMIEDIIGKDEDHTVPDFIKKSVRVDRKKFEALPTSEQNIWKPALTRKHAPAKIEVKQNV
jgi:hypothetical protein